MKRNDDLIRAVGYVVIQASHLEREIEDICQYIGIEYLRPEHHETKRVSDKIKWCKSKIKVMNDSRLHDLDKCLDKAKNFLDKRNKLVHGQIYFAPDAPEKIIPSSKGGHERYILPADVYDLAESIYELHSSISSQNGLRLVAVLGKK